MQLQLSDSMIFSSGNGCQRYIVQRKRALDQRCRRRSFASRSLAQNRCGEGSLRSQRPAFESLELFRQAPRQSVRLFPEASLTRDPSRANAGKYC